MGDIFVITPLPKALCLTLSPRAKVSVFSGFGVSGAEEHLDDYAALLADFQ